MQPVQDKKVETRLQHRSKVNTDNKDKTEDRQYRTSKGIHLGKKLPTTQV